LLNNALKSGHVEPAAITIKKGRPTFSIPKIIAAAAKLMMIGVFPLRPTTRLKDPLSLLLTPGADPIKFQLVILHHKSIFSRHILLEHLDALIFKLQDRSALRAD